MNEWIKITDQRINSICSVRQSEPLVNALVRKCEITQGKEKDPRPWQESNSQPLYLTIHCSDNYAQRPDGNKLLVIMVVIVVAMWMRRVQMNVMPLALRAQSYGALAALYFHMLYGWQYETVSRTGNYARIGLALHQGSAMYR